MVSLTQLEEVLPPLPLAEVHPHDVAAHYARVHVVVLEGERLGTLDKDHTLCLIVSCGYNDNIKDRSSQ